MVAFTSPLQAATVVAGQSYEAAVYRALRNAQEHVVVDLPRLSCGNAENSGPVLVLLRELLIAAVRGVAVELSCPTDSLPPHVSHALRQQGVQVKHGADFNRLTRLTADNEIIVGSHVWTPESLQSSYEVSFVFGNNEPTEPVSRRSAHRQAQKALSRATQRVAMACAIDDAAAASRFEAHAEALVGKGEKQVRPDILIRQHTVTPLSFDRLFSDREPAVAAAFRLHERRIPVRLSTVDVTFSYNLVVADDVICFGVPAGTGFLQQFRRSYLVIDDPNAAASLELFVNSIPGATVQDMLAYH